MVQKIKDVKDIEWFISNKPLQDKDLVLLKDFPFKLPSQFIALLKVSDGGHIDYDFSNEEVFCNIGEIYGIATPSTMMRNKNYDYYSDRRYEKQEFFITEHDIINQYNDPPEFLPLNLVGFGRTGGGDLICFDYRANPKTDNPPIVYWRHDADIGKDVSFVANSFEEFITMLQEPEKFEYNQDQD